MVARLLCITRGRCTATLPPWKPIFPLVLPQRWPTRPPPRLCGVPASCCASSQSICSMAPIPAVRQKRSKELSTSCQAVLTVRRANSFALVRYFSICDCTAVLRPPFARLTFRCKRLFRTPSAFCTSTLTHDDSNRRLGRSCHLNLPCRKLGLWKGRL